MIAWCEDRSVTLILRNYCRKPFRYRVVDWSEEILQLGSGDGESTSVSTYSTG